MQEGIRSELWNRARDLKISGNYEGAIEILKELIEFCDESSYLDLMRFINYLAAIYLKTEKIDLAEMTGREALRLEEEFGDCGLETTRLADRQYFLAEVLEKKGALSEARLLMRQAIPIYFDLLGADNSYAKGAEEFGKRIGL